MISSQGSGASRWLAILLTVTSAVAFPVDKTPLTIRSGHFTTLHNQENHELKNQGYFCRGIHVSRSRMRIDAHCGVMNATIRNSKIGFVGINAIGWGTFLVENTTVYGRCFFNLRSDYGSTWDGEFVVRNCTYVPACGKTACGVLVGGRNDGKHDYGYVCHMPRKITVEGLKIDDRNHPAGYEGAWIFGNICPANTSKGFAAPYPYHVTEEVVLKDIATASGERLRVSPNEFMFKDVRVVRDGMRKWKVPARPADGS